MLLNPDWQYQVERPGLGFGDWKPPQSSEQAAQAELPGGLRAMVPPQLRDRVRAGPEHDAPFAQH
eukprot:10632999-Lingulodinium_polyedra.AAC.1